MFRHKEYRPGTLVRLESFRDNVNSERCAWVEKYKNNSWQARAINYHDSILKLRKSMIGMYIRETSDNNYGEFLFEEERVHVAYQFLEEIK